MSRESEILSALKKRENGATYEAINKVLGSLNHANEYRETQNTAQINSKSKQPELQYYPDAEPRTREDVSFEELKEQANEYADEYYEGLVAKENEKSGVKLGKLSAEMEENRLSGERKLAKAQSDYESEAEKVRERSIKNGMVNSSIFGLLNEENLSEFTQKRREIEADMALTEESLRNEMNLVEESRKLALRDYDIKRAEAYEKKLQELYEEEMRARAAINEYNRRLNELKNNYEENKKRTEKEWQKAIKSGKINK